MAKQGDGVAAPAMSFFFRYFSCHRREAARTRVRMGNRDGPANDRVVCIVLAGFSKSLDEEGNAG